MLFEVQVSHLEQKILAPFYEGVSHCEATQSWVKGGSVTNDQSPSGPASGHNH